MQDRMNPADRKLLAAAGIVLVLIVAGGVLFAPPPDDENPVPSTYASGSGGARAAYLLLAELGYRVSRWEEPPTMLADAARGAVLILAEPADAPAKDDVAALRRFVNSGGRVLFCGPSVATYFPGALVSPEGSGETWKEFSPNFPSYLSRQARTIAMQPKAHWDILSPSQLALYGGDDAAVIVDWRMGQGQVLWWAAATPLTNAGILRDGNLNLLLNAVSLDGEQGSEIYWDEYFHGQRRSLWNYFEATPLKWGLVQIGLAALAILFTFSRRSGPIVPALAPSRLSPLEFVETMGGLYERAGAASVPVAVSYRRFRFELARRLGLPSTAINADLAQAAAKRLGLPEETLRQALENAAAADLHGRKLSPPRALKLVQTLEEYESQLKHPKLAESPTLQEKH